MSGSVDRMRARKWERLEGVAMPSLSASPDHLPAYAPTLSTPVAPMIQPSLAPELQLRAPESSSFQLRDPSTMFQTAASATAPAPSPKKPNFLMRDAFGGFKWWHVLLGGAGTLAVGVGLYKIATGGPARATRYAR